MNPRNEGGPRPDKPRQPPEAVAGAGRAHVAFGVATNNTGGTTTGSALERNVNSGNVVAGNVTGGDDYSNVISGDPGDGIEIIGSGTDGKTVDGSCIGLNGGNANKGVGIPSVARNNAVDGTTSGAGNVNSDHFTADTVNRRRHPRRLRQLGRRHPGHRQRHQRQRGRGEQQRPQCHPGQPAERRPGHLHLRQRHRRRHRGRLPHRR